MRLIYKHINANHCALGIGLFLLMAAISTPIVALEDDDEQEIQIVADTSQYDNQNGVAIYTGNVEVDQGSRHLSADTLHIYRGENGDINKIIATGNPARFHYQPEIDGPLMYGKALTITYQDDLNQLELEDDAEVTQEGDVYRAPYIIYDTVTEIISSPRHTEGRTTVIIQQRDN